MRYRGGGQRREKAVGLALLHAGAVLGFLVDLVGSLIGGEAGWRLAIRDETRRLQRDNAVACLYRSSPADEWKPYTCQVDGDDLVLTTFPFGAAFTLAAARARTTGTGPVMTEGPTTLVAVTSGQRHAELAVPDVMLGWFLERTTAGS